MSITFNHSLLNNCSIDCFICRFITSPVLPSEAPEALVQGREGVDHAAAPQAPAVLSGPGAEVLQGLQEPLAVGGPRLQLPADGLHDLPNGAIGRYLLIL